MVERRTRIHGRLFLLLTIAYHQLSFMVMVIESAPGSTDPFSTQAPCVPAPPVFPDWRGVFAGTLVSLGSSVVDQLILDAIATARAVNATTTFCAAKVNMSAFNEGLSGCNPVDLSPICLQPQQTTFRSTAAFIPTSDLRSTVGMTSIAKITSAPATSGAFNPPPVTTSSANRLPMTASSEVDGFLSTSTARSDNAASSTLETAATSSLQTKHSSAIPTTVVSQSNSDLSTMNTTVFWQDQTPNAGEVVQPPNGNVGLAQGAVAGIVIGVLVFVLAAVILVFCIVARCRQDKYPVQHRQPPQPNIYIATPPGNRAGATTQNIFNRIKAIGRVSREDSQLSTAPIIPPSRQYSFESSGADSDSGSFSQSGGPPVTASKNIALNHALPLQKVDEQNVANRLQNSERIASPGGARVPDMPRSDPLQRRQAVVNDNGLTSTLPRSLSKLQNTAANNGSAIAPGTVQPTPLRNGIDNRGFRPDAVDHDGSANNKVLESAFDDALTKLSQNEQSFWEIEMGSGKGLNERTPSRDGFDEYLTSSSSLDLKPPDESLADSGTTMNI